MSTSANEQVPLDTTNITIRAARLRNKDGTFAAKPKETPVPPLQDKHESDEDTVLYPAPPQEFEDFLDNEFPDDFESTMSDTGGADVPDIPVLLPLFNEKIRKFSSTTGKDATIKMSKVEKFNGDSKFFRSWSSSMDLRFVRYPESFATSECRIAEIAEHCTDRASSWMNSVLTGEREDLIENYEVFIKEFMKTFQDKQYLTCVTFPPKISSSSKF